MKETFIAYFTNRHLLVNLITVVVLVGGFLAWQNMPREELPGIDLWGVSITVSYPGASPYEIDQLITTPIESSIRSISGIDRIKSQAKSGVSSTVVYINKDVITLDEATNEIRNRVMMLKLPGKPYIRKHTTEDDAIMTIGIYDPSSQKLDDEKRRKIQEFVISFQSRILKLQEVSSADLGGYHKPEFRIEADPVGMNRYNTPISEVMKAIKENHVRGPAGDLANLKNERVTIRSALDTKEKLENTVIRETFEGLGVRLRDVARVRNTFAESESLVKLNGHEAVFVNIVKNGSSGIIETATKVQEELTRIRSSQDSEKGYVIQVVSDQSRGVDNRMSLVVSNGAIGFLLIILTLLAFLNLSSAVWVAMGIPFTMAFTLIIANIMGYSVNNVTLAGMIIVLGMVVDDAIVVAENIHSLREKGVPPHRAAAEGAAYVFLPITASILTTIMAFIPLLGFDNKFAAVNEPFPVIISIMLLGSIVESILILPAHLVMPAPAWLRKIYSFGLAQKLTSLAEKRLKKGKEKEKKTARQKKSEPPLMKKAHWFDRIEEGYARSLEKVLVRRKRFLLLFLLIPILAVVLFVTGMRFILFPKKEVTETIVSVAAPGMMSLADQERLSRQVDRVLEKYRGNEVLAYQSNMTRGKWGSGEELNRITWTIQLKPRDQRKKPLTQLEEEWKDKLKDLKGLSDVQMRQARFGQESGRPLELWLQDNNDERRREVADRLARELETLSAVENLLVERPRETSEYHISIDGQKAARLGISPSRSGDILRTIVEGRTLYNLLINNIETGVRLIVPEEHRSSLERVLAIPVANRGHYLIPLSEIVSSDLVSSPSEVYKEDGIRTVRIFAGIVRGSDESPLSIARQVEEKILPVIHRNFPNTLIQWGGEVKDSRETSRDFMGAILLVLFLIYSLMAVLFNSMTRPIIVMLAIPFGVAGIIIALRAHGIDQFGIFTSVGALGLSGIVVNDAIIMIVRLQDIIRNAEKVTPALITEAARSRIRPVVMTTISTVAGLLPTAYGIAGYDYIISDMMLAISWGLIVGTIVVLFLIPILFSLTTTMEKT